MSFCKVCSGPVHPPRRTLCSPECRYRAQQDHKKSERGRALENERRRRKDRPPCRQCGEDISDRTYQASLCEACARLNELDNLRSSVTKSKYGITWAKRLAMQAAQGDCCWACGDLLKPHGKKREVGERALGVIDHCHDTGAVRGILCSPCNSVEGHIRNGRVEMLRRYLAKFG